MNENLMVKFQRDGESLRVRKLSEDGLVLGNETSAWPRGFTFRMSPRDPVTKEKIKRLRQKKGWPGDAPFPLKVSRVGENLRIHGRDAASLPAGRYTFALYIGGMKLKENRHDVKIPEGGADTVTLDEKLDNRRLVLAAQVSEFDDQTRRIVRHTRSRLDGQPAAMWLRDAKYQDRRKACLLNILAKIRTLPTVNKPLSAKVQSVFFADPDRIYTMVDSGFLQLLKDLRIFRKDRGSPVSIHERLKTRIPNDHGDAYKLHSFRERSNPSVQIVVAEPPASLPDKTQYAEMDIDLGSPSQGPKGLLIHIGEVLHPARTDHLNLRRKLAGAPTSDFLYYRVEKT